MTKQNLHINANKCHDYTSLYASDGISIFSSKGNKHAVIKTSHLGIARQWKGTSCLEHEQETAQIH